MKPGIRRLIEDLRGARVLVVHPRDAEGDALIDQLKRIGCNVRGMWPPPSELPRDVDTVFHLVETAETPAFMASAAEDGPTFVAIVDYENPTVLQAPARQQCAWRHQQADPSFRHPFLACARPLDARLHAPSRETRCRSSRRRLKARRDVDKAVKILVALKQIGEADAYELIRAAGNAEALVDGPDRRDDHRRAGCAWRTRTDRRALTPDGA